MSPDSGAPDRGKPSPKALAARDAARALAGDAFRAVLADSQEAATERRAASGPSGEG